MLHKLFIDASIKFEIFEQSFIDTVLTPNGPKNKNTQKGAFQ
jgi:hypothetical protein